MSHHLHGVTFRGIQSSANFEWMPNQKIKKKKKKNLPCYVKKLLWAGNLHFVVVLFA